MWKKARSRKLKSGLWGDCVTTMISFEALPFPLPTSVVKITESSWGGGVGEEEGAGGGTGAAGIWMGGGVVVSWWVR